MHEAGTDNPFIFTYFTAITIRWVPLGAFMNCFLLASFAALAFGVFILTWPVREECS